MECAAQMNVQYQLEIRVGHFLQRRAANDPGIVDEDVDPSVMVERRLDDRLAAFGRGHRLGARDRLATRGADLLHHLLRGTYVDAVALEAGARIVDDTFAPLDARSRA